MLEESVWHNFVGGKFLKVPCLFVSVVFSSFSKVEISCHRRVGKVRFWVEQGRTVSSFGAHEYLE